MTESAQHRAEEAERLLAEPLFRSALRRIEDEALNELLTASGPSAAGVREACANRINVVRALPQMIKAAAFEAKAELKQRASVA